MALVDDPDRSLGVDRLAVGAGKPAAAILDPEFVFRGGIGPNAIFDAIENAVALVAALCLKPRVETVYSAIGIYELCVTAAARYFPSVCAEHLTGIAAPDELVAANVPDIGRTAARREDVGGIERRRLSTAVNFAIVAGAGGKNRTIRIFFPNVARHVALLRVCRLRAPRRRAIGQITEMA